MLLRRHYVYKEQAHERSVGGGEGDTTSNLLGRWLARRDELQRHESIARFLAFFFDLAGGRGGALSRGGYVAFFQCVGRALVQSLSTDHALAAAERDWAYDSAGHDGPTMPYARFVAALFETAELVLPVETEAAGFVGLWLELRDAIAIPEPALAAAASALAAVAHPTTTTTTSTAATPQLHEAVTYRLRPPRDVTKLRGPLLQRLAPGPEQLGLIRGLPPPDAATMSLKQLLLCYNPRKFALSRKFSALFEQQGAPPAASESEPPMVSMTTTSTTTTRPAPPSALLQRESRDPWDEETAVPRGLETFPALRIAVVGPPGAGKTRLAQSLARRLGLQYLGIPTVLTMAVERKRQRDARTRARRAAREEAEAQAAEAGAETPPGEAGVALASGIAEGDGQGDGESGPSDTAEAPATAIDDRDPEDREEDALFSDAELAALERHGRALARAKLLPLAGRFARESLLRGVGVVLDDIHPSELRATPLGVDYVIALELSRDDARRQLAGTALAPTTRAFYSARELAMLRECDAALEDLGFADRPRVEDVPNDELEEEELLRRRRVAEAAARKAATEAARAAAAAEAAALAAEAGGDSGETAGQDPGEETEGNGGEGGTESSSACVEAPPLTPAVRNGVAPLTEPTVPVQELILSAFDARYQEYLGRVGVAMARAHRANADELSPPATPQVVSVLAAQAPENILAQCIDAISKNPYGLGRHASSRVAVPLTLPDELVNGGNRAEQLRWLLHGDWTELREAEAQALAQQTSEQERAFARLPVAGPRSRRLSRWRECCIVSSTSATPGPVLGDPRHAVYYSGRVYLLASPAHERAFVAHPWQYLTREPPPRPPQRRLWVLASGPLDPGTRAALAGLVGAEEDGVLSATTFLDAHHSVRSEMALLSGQVLDGPTALAGGLAEALIARERGWVLVDLMPSKAVLEAMRAHGCLPEAILVLVPPPLAPASSSTASASSSSSSPSALLDRAREEAWRAQFAPTDDTPAPFLTTLLADVELADLPVKTTPWFTDDPSATAAAMHRILSPLAPRVDAVDDGTIVNAEEAARVFTPAATDKGDGDEAVMTDKGEGDSGAAAAAAVAEAVEAEALSRRVCMGETAQYCPVTWATKRLLVPGLAEHAVSFEQRFYACAGATERRAFERNPRRYVPTGALATDALVPVVWLLGGRGVDVAALASCICGGDSTTPSTVAIVDHDGVLARAMQRRRLQSLLPEDKQTPLLELYVDELVGDVARLRAMSPPPGAIVLGGLGIDVVEGDEAPATTGTRLPTPELLARLFERDLYPTVVAPLVATEAVAVDRQLQQWRARQPIVRRSMARTKLRAMNSGEDPAEAGGEAAQDGDGVEDDGPSLQEREAEETARLQEQFQGDQGALDAALGVLRDRGCTVLPGISADGTLRATRKALEEALGGFLRRKASVFEYCEEVVGLEAIRGLLGSGEASVGQHGLLDPITGHGPTEGDGGWPPPGRLRALRHRDRLYFPWSPASLAACRDRPSLLTQSPTHPPAHRPTCAVVGPSSSGKSRLARALAAHHGLVYVTPRGAIDWVLQCHGRTELAESLRAAPSTATIDGVATHDALVARLRSAECQARGWVLDGYLQSPIELRRCLGALDEQQAVHPELVVVLEATYAWVWDRVRRRRRASASANTNAVSSEEAAEVDAATPGSTHHEDLVRTLAAWHRQRLDLLDTWLGLFGGAHVLQLDATQCSSWGLRTQASAALEGIAEATRRFRQDRVLGRPARLGGVLVPAPVLARRRHPVYQSLCPVSLLGTPHALYREPPVDRALAVALGEVVVFGADAEALAILTDPKAGAEFLGDDAVTRATGRVARSPIDCSLLSLVAVADAEFPELKGYCPVTFARGTGDKDWHALVRGRVLFRATYEDRVFFLATEAARQSFVRAPGAFAHQELPVKLPPQLPPLLGRQCPGRLEQELAGVLNETLVRLGALRPKFLGVDARASACVHLALLLKTRARHERGTGSAAVAGAVRAVYVRRLEAFERDCCLGERLRATSALAPPRTAATSCGPGIKGARAVRAEDRPGPGPSDQAKDDDAERALVDEAERLRARFDELAAELDTGGGGGRSPNNQRGRLPRSRPQFLAYAEPVDVDAQTLLALVPDGRPSAS